MRIKANTERGTKVRVFKDKEEITNRCTEVEEDGSMAINLKLDDNDHVYLDDSGELAKEIVYDVIVLEKGN